MIKKIKEDAILRDCNSCENWMSEEQNSKFAYCDYWSHKTDIGGPTNIYTSAEDGCEHYRRSNRG